MIRFNSLFKTLILSAFFVLFGLNSYAQFPVNHSPVVAATGGVVVNRTVNGTGGVYRDDADPANMPANYDGSGTLVFQPACVDFNVRVTFTAVQFFNRDLGDYLLYSYNNFGTVDTININDNGTFPVLTGNQANGGQIWFRYVSNGVTNNAQGWSANVDLDISAACTSPAVALGPKISIGETSGTFGNPITTCVNNPTDVVPLNFSFLANNLYQCAGLTQDIDSVDIDFGNGDPVLTGVVLADVDAADPNVYTSATQTASYGIGSYTITVTFYDNYGCTATATRNIVIYGPNFTGATTYDICQGAPVTLSQQHTNNPGETTSTVTWLGPKLTSAPTALDSTWKTSGNTLPIFPGKLKLNGLTQQTFSFQYRVQTTGTGGCEYVSDLALTVYQQSTAGTFTNGTPVLICANETALELNDYINPDPAGLTYTNVSWKAAASNPGTAPFNDADALPSNINPTALNAAGGPGLYRYFLYTKNGVCKADSVAATVNIVREPYAGQAVATLIELCEANTSFALKDSLDEGGIAPDNGGIWYINNKKIVSDTIVADRLNASKLTPGNYSITYEVKNPTCGSRSQDLFIRVLDNPTVSRDTTFDVCSDESLILLYDFLNRSSSDPGNDTDRDFTDESVTLGSGNASTSFAASPGFFDPQNEMGGEGKYVFKYVAADNVPPCLRDSITITINYYFAPEAGADNSADVCGSDNAYDLTQLIDPAASSVTGRYYDITNSAPLAGSTVDLTVLTDGSYDYYYIIDAKGNCDGDTALFTLNVTEFFSPGADVTVTICETDPSFALFSVLTPDAELGGAFTGGASGNDALTFNPAGKGGQTLTINYRQGANGFCPDTVAVLTLIIGKEVMAGPDAAIDTCAIPNIILSDYVSATNGFPTAADPTITWSFVSAGGVVPITDATNTGVADFSGLLGTYDIYYIVSSPSCIDTAVITITTYRPPYAGEDSYIVACTDDAPFIPFNQELLPDGADVGGIWIDQDGTGGFADLTMFNSSYDPANATPTGDEGGIFYYEVKAPFCPTDSAEITAFISEAPSVGLSDSAFACADETDFDLYETLTGDYTQGGYWTLKDISTFTVANLTPIRAQVNNYMNEYIKDGDGPKDKSVLDIDSLVSLLSRLGYPDCDIYGGVYTFQYVASDTSTFEYPVTGGVAIPAPCTDKTGIGYLIISKDWSYLANGSLTDADGNPEGEVEYKGTKFDVCQDNNNFNMNFEFFAPGTNEFVSCSPTDTLQYTSVPLTPAVDGSNVFVAGLATAGSYVITQTIKTAGCADVKYRRPVTINVIKAPDSGLPNSVTLCKTETAYELDSALLGTPDANGSWTNVGPALPPATISGARNQFFDASKVTPGAGPFSFEYTITSTACGTTSKTIVSISVEAEPILGADQNITLCSSIEAQPMVDYFQNPNFDQSGTFTSACAGFSGTTMADAVFSPKTNGVGTCEVLYTVNSVACGLYERRFTFTVVAPDSAGADNTVQFCETRSSVNLTAQLVNPSTTSGTFFNSVGTAITPPNFSPLANGPGTYCFTYRVPSTNGCPLDEANICIIVNQQYDPGTDGTITICDTRTSVDLLNEVLTGAPDVVSTPVRSEFDANNPTLDDALSGNSDEILDISVLKGLITTPGTFKFKYSVPANGACPSSNATATVIIQASPKPGKSAINNVDVCSSETSYSLFTALGVAGTDYTTGGTWKNANGITTAAIINPNLLPGGVNKYTYNLSGSGVCKDTSSVVNVNIIAKPRAGTDRDTTICSDLTSINLFSIIKNFQGGGLWADINNHGGLVPTTGDVNLTITTGAPLKYYYIVKNGICTPDTSVATINITTKPNPGKDILVEVCNTLNSYDLFSAFIDNGITYDAGGLWTDAATGKATNPIDPTKFGVGPHQFIYTLTNVGGCRSTYSARVTVNFIRQPFTGTALDTMICSSAGVIDLFNYVDGEDGGGTWIAGNSSGFTSPSSVNPTSLNGNITYEYQINRGGCTSSTFVIIKFVPRPNAGIDTTGVSCVNADADLELFLSAAAVTGGQFTALSPAVVSAGALNGNIFQASKVGQGVYSFKYRVEAVGCAADESVIKITVVESGTDTSIVTCLVGDTIDLNKLSGNISSANAWVSVIPPSTAALKGKFFIPTRVLNPGKFTLELSDAPGVQTGCVTQVNIEVVDTLLITQKVDCDLVFEQFQLILDIEGGMTNATGDYTIDGLQGSQVNTADGKRFTSTTYDFGQEITFTVSDSTGICNQQVFVASTDCDILAIVPEGFSPNGDGKNDFLVIDQVNEFPNNKLVIYNRWGGIVFEANGYSNNWDGTYQENGGDLPDGTYFYVFETGVDGKKPVKGYIYISR